MKGMYSLTTKKELLFVFAISVLFVLINAYSAIAAYSIKYLTVQHRVYESGSEVNNLGFEIWDDSIPGDALTNVANNWTLTYEKGDPSNEQIVQLGDSSFSYGAYTALNGEYVDGSWVYDALETEAGNYYYQYIIDTNFDPPLPGVYTLDVTFSDFSTDNIEYTFNGFVDLPIISAFSFRKQMSPNGFTLYWNVPDLTGITVPTLSRGYFIFSDDIWNYLGELYVRVPSDLGYIYVPDTVVDLFGDVKHTTVSIQVMTDDVNNRSYSLFVDVDDIPTVPDADGDNDVDGLDLANVVNQLNLGMVGSNYVAEFANTFGFAD